MTANISDPSGLEREALAAYESGDLEAAADLFQSAASATEDPMKSAELANSLSVVLLMQGHAEQALEAALGTPEVFAEAGDVGRHARAWGNLASAWEACNQTEEAEQAYRRAAKLFEQTGEEEERLATLTALSQLQLRQRRPLEAAATLQAGGSAGKVSGLRARFLSFLLRIPSRLLRS